MKTIETINIWNNGTNQSATILNLNCINDNMFDAAIFSYQLFTDEIVTVSNGELTLNEPDYTKDWISNDAAYNWAAIQLGLTITGEYIPPVPIEPIEK